MNEKAPFIFIADSHLPADDSVPQFFEMLDRIAETSCNLVFLGDIFELWIAYPSYEFPIHRKFLDWCSREKKNRIIGFIEGNHEFYVTARYADLFSWGTTDSRLIDDGKVLLLHGDTINRADSGYRLLRSILRNPLFRFLAWLTGPIAGKFLSEKIRLSLKTTNMKHKKDFPEKYLDELADRLEKERIDLCIAGHFHRKASFRNIRILPAWEPDGEAGIYFPATGEFRIENWNKLLSKEILS